jgi:D-aminopeptidase
MTTLPLPRPRLRDLGILLGEFQPGPFNSITDIPGVLVGQCTLIQDSPSVVRTGVTAIFPRLDIHRDNAYAAYYSFSGIGEMTGIPFLEETGLLTSPVLLTNTNQVGLVHEALARYGTQKHAGFAYKLSIVAETWDGWLNDAHSFPLKDEHVIAALESASSGPLAEGNTGGGAGMIGYEFKGGTGTSSRCVEVLGNAYTVGALVQLNQGERRHLLVDGAPVGRRISEDILPTPWPSQPLSSSIIIIIGTDAPLLPHHCRRLAQRATVGLARTGGFGLATSGDIFLAFSTGVHPNPEARPETAPPPDLTTKLLRLDVLPDFTLDPLVIAAAEAVEESILNALVAADTMTGFEGHTAHALPHHLLIEAWKTSHP